MGLRSRSSESGNGGTGGISVLEPRKIERGCTRDVVLGPPDTLDDVVDLLDADPVALLPKNDDEAGVAKVAVFFPVDGLSARLSDLDGRSGVSSNVEVERFRKDRESGSGKLMRSAACIVAASSPSISIAFGRIFLGMTGLSASGGSEA
jgi:hypothetical protein